jgi:hypothetical protein
MTILRSTRSSASKLEIAAHEYVANGWPVLPLEPRGKKPITKHGYKDATRSHEQVAKYWSSMPDANVGIATGDASGLFVLDIDGHVGEAAIVRRFDLPPTAQVRTSKGRHLYFGMPDGARLGLTVNRLAEQADTRGNGGYIVAPPSVHPSGHVYGWVPGCSPEEIQLAPLPDSLIFALMKPAEPTRLASSAPTSDRQGLARRGRAALLAFRDFLALAPRHLADGQGRNNTAFSISCFALKVMPLSEVNVVVRHWNADNRDALSEAEVNAVINSASRRVGRGVTW